MTESKLPWPISTAVARKPRAASSPGFNDPQESVPEFEIWPNPTAEYLYVRLAEPSTLALYDSEGMPVMQKAFRSGISRIDLPYAPKGIYVLANGKGASRKIIKE